MYRKIWLVNFLVPLFEPLLYLAAFGIGLSALIGKVSYHGTELSYIEFIAPALLAITIMYNAFFENTYASFVRMYYQKTFDAMMATPLSLEDIIAGEIVWGATKSVIAAAIMLAVISLFGLVHFPHGLSDIAHLFSGRACFWNCRDGFYRSRAQYRHVQPSDFSFYNPDVSFQRDLFPNLDPSRVGSKPFPGASPDPPCQPLPLSLPWRDDGSTSYGVSFI